MSEFLDLYNSLIKDIWVRDGENYLIITPTIFFPGTSESIALQISKDENGYVITDCHTLTDYWEEIDLPCDDYKERIDKICNKFGLEFQGNTLKKQTYVEDEVRLFKAIGFFLQGMFLLANVYI